MSIRVIPRLDIKGPNLVKGVHLEGLRVLGKPWDYAFKYYLNGADELIYMDVVASLYGRNSLVEIVKRTAENIFIPLTVGGGIRSLDDIRTLLRAGADKVAINTAAVHNPELIKEAAEAFGSQCIVLSIEAKKIGDHYEAFTDNGREPTRKDALEWAEELVAIGAGEILLTSIDREGTGKGYDLELIQQIAEAVPVPVIACGGCGNPGHMVDAVQKGRADALSAASIFHYGHLADRVDEGLFKTEGNLEFMQRREGYLPNGAKRVRPMDFDAVKQELMASGILCRARNGNKWISNW